ncbi:MAG: hypothetical protein ABJF04_21090 [Reichenbachiella sp.]|uniref:tetratricopeptide repeat protein n=1 Tax=Reichenbachiella sp. TaxID=2184521 RepID=UPI0032666B3A
MRKMEEAEVFIRDYFNGRLSTEENQSFRDRYDNDAEFKVLADQIEVELLGIRSHGREQLKSKFQSWDEEASSEFVKRPFPFFKMGIAASLILAFLYLGKMLLPSNREDLFLAYYHPYENFEYTPTREEVEASSDKHKAYTEYDAKNYAKAALFFDKVILVDSMDVPAIFFRGLCQIEAQSYEKALSDLMTVIESNDPYYSDAALWYMSLIELKFDRLDKAKRYLERLHSSKDYQARAHKLLEELN